MKTKFIKYLAVFTAVMIVNLSCTDHFEELNTNPTTATMETWSPVSMLSTVQLTYTGSIDNSYETWRTNLIYFLPMMQHLSSTNSLYNGGDKYTVTNVDFPGSYFDRAYDEQVKVIVDLVELTRNNPNHHNLHQVARLMKALVFQRITDIYGDVPYFEAGLGYRNKNFFPKYDSQEAIYEDLLKEIEDATEKLDPEKEKLTHDLYYAGNIEKWKRFGNTLLLRTGMRLTKVNPQKAQQIVLKVQGKTMQSNADNAILEHDVSGNRTTWNRLANVFVEQREIQNIRISKTLVDNLKAKNDPRLGVIAELPSAGANSKNPAFQLGLPNGHDENSIKSLAEYDADLVLNVYSRPGSSFLSLTAPTFILTYAESELLLADAAVRWGIGGDADEHYRNGVIAGITYFGQYGNDAAAVVNLTAATTYADAHPLSSFNSQAEKLEAINYEFWVATFLNGYETWSNWRRTGLPVLVPTNHPSKTYNEIPRRMHYPVGESSVNTANYNAAVAKLPGGDNLIGRVWWDSTN